MERRTPSSAGIDVEAPLALLPGRGRPGLHSVVDFDFPMKHISNWALNIASLRGATYADVRVVAQRSRALTTKNGKVGSASDAESVGMSVRVIADGAWGFAASADLGRGAVEATAARAVEIARASARVKQHDVQFAAEKA